uniref:Small ribosomal subunit protein uS10c n=1 Tax=Aegilops tauschii subsp. strangulata TaxID=200361 RepID=A0A453IRD4_AEGTS
MSIVHVCVQLLFGATAGKETVSRARAQSHSSFSDSFNVSQERIVITNSSGEKLIGVLHEAGSKDIVVLCHGFSKGGDVVIIYASMYQDVSRVINISGRFDLKRGIADRLGSDYMERINQHGFIDVAQKTGQFMYRVTKESLMDRLRIDMQSACMSIGPNCRVLTVHGSDDDVVPSEDALEFHKYIGNHEVHIIEGADHRYSSHRLELANILAPKQKIRIKLRSYWVPLIEDSCKQIIEAAKTTNAKTMGPVPLPTKKRIYCVLNSPHVHKDSRFHFEIRTHQRLIDIMYPTAQTIDSLMQLQLPAGVDVEVKL